MLVTSRAPAARDRVPPLRVSRPTWRKDSYLLAAVFALAAFIWVAHAGLWTLDAWHHPAAYRGDAFEVLARIKAAADGDLAPWSNQRIERLGAPFGANWAAYPTPEKAQLYLLGIVARWTDIFVASNLGMMCAFGLAAAVFAWVVWRWLRVGWEWATVGGLLFAFSYSVVHRGMPHYSFVLTWVVPLSLLACWLVARRAPLKWGGAPFWWCVAAGAAMGCHNTYYLFFWLQLLGLAAFVQWLRARHLPNLGAAAAAAAAAVSVFVLVNLDYWVATQTDETMALLQRNYGGTERYALKPVEMFIPPAVHRAAPMAFLGQRYGRWSEWRGEEFLPYLGVIGVIAIGWLLWITVPRLVRGGRVPGASLAVGWLVAFASIGGLTNFMAFFGGVFLFRATNRIVVFIAAILLVFLVVRLSRCTAAWQPRWRLMLALSLAAVGLFDQLPRGEEPAARAQIASMMDSDRRFVTEVEQRLGAGGAIFQLPVLGFPEVNPPWKLSDYEHFRPYLHAEALRFSYGVPKFRPRGRWQGEVERLPAAAMARRLEQYGFAALYLNRRGFEDGGERLLASLAEAGYTQQLRSPLGGQVVVPLRPSSAPVLPVARSFTPGLGWQTRIIEGVRWAQGPGVLLFYNPHREERLARVSLHLQLPWSQRLALRRDGRVVGEWASKEGDARFELTEVAMQPGINSFVLSGEAKRGSGAQSSLRAFGLVSSSIELTPATSARR